MKKIKLNDLFNKILIIFLLIQPIFDIKFFYNSISTLIRVIVIFILFLYYFFTSKNRHKYFLIIYPCLLSIYFIFHHLNALNFQSLVPGNFGYSIFKEILYFVKMVSPFLLIYSLYKANLSTAFIIRIMKILVLIISLIIVVSNLLEFSYGSYSDSIIKANFFEWFNFESQYSYQDLASKGLFEYGNQIAAVLIMFLPFMIYNALENHKFIDWCTLILNAFALLLLCTKVSVLGVLIVFIYTLLAFSFIYIIQKKHIEFKRYIPIYIILLTYSLLLPFNPMFSRITERQTVIETFNNENSNELAQNEDVVVEQDLSLQNLQTTESESVFNSTTTDTVPDNSNYMIEYIENNYENKQLNKQFLFENYPYQYDTEFWYSFLQNDISVITDYRYIELSMIKRVVEVNNNSMDKWFGITNTRVQNIFNIEKDFVVQYYALRYYWCCINLYTIFYIAWNFYIQNFLCKIY